MADPKLQIEQKVEDLEKQVARQELAIGTMCQWLVQAQTGFTAKDAEGIELIMREGGVDERREGSDDHSDHEQQAEPRPEVS